MAQLGKYQLIAELARGGMGIVTLALARGPAGFSKLAVVKELKAELADDPAFTEMFLEEARLAARLNHPNIVQTYEIGAEDGRTFMVMDYLDGVTLARMARKMDPAFTTAMQIRIACEILQGLQYAHTLTDFDGTPLGIVHRDVTPQNVFVTFDGQVKLVDFGIAKAVDSPIETRAGVLKGKPGYMAPEQIGGRVDGRSDVFSVGVLLWEAVAGRRMWLEHSEVEILSAILKGDLPRLAEVRPDTPAKLIAIVDRAIAIRREDRYESARALQLDLEAYLASSGTNVVAREVCDLAGVLFADERTRRRAAIDRCLQQARSSDPLVPTTLLSLPAPDAGSGAQSRPVTGGTAIGHQLSLPPPVSTGGYVRAGGIVTAAALLVAGAYLLGTRSIRAPADVQAAPPPPALPSRPEPAPAARAAHELSIRVSPARATVTIDGLAATNPVVHICSPGDHLLLRASAPGFIARDRELVCERTEAVEIALAETAPVPLAPAPAPAPAPVPASPTPPRRPAHEPTADPTSPSAPRAPAHPPAATIDTGNPWR